jgi:hypothetical protein
MEDEEIIVGFGDAELDVFMLPIFVIALRESKLHTSIGAGQSKIEKRILYV